MGVGHGTGDDRAKEAVLAAVDSPLLETEINGAKAILLYIAGGYNLGMMEVNEIASLVEEKADDEAILIFGAAVSEDMEDEISITVIATGFEDEEKDDKVGFQQVEQMQGKKKVVTPEGLEGTEVTIGDLFGDRDEDPKDSKFDIPSFLNEE